MPISIRLLRPEGEGGGLGQIDAVRESEKRRGKKKKIFGVEVPRTHAVDEAARLDKEWRTQQFNMEQLRKKMNAEVNQKMKERKTKDNKAPCTDLLELKAQITADIATAEMKAKTLLHERDEMLECIGCLVNAAKWPASGFGEKPVHFGDAPAVNKSTHPQLEDIESENEVVFKWGTPRQFDVPYQTDGFRPHFELLEMIGGVNFEAGRDVFGSRGYFLTGPAVVLNQALINYGLAFLMKDGYTPVQPPFMMKANVMGACAELADYDEVLYKVVGEGEEDRYLIATSEQPITALYRNKTIDKKELPLRFAGSSSCFRKEAGSSGRDIRGIFRCHQFEKVEQFCIVEEDKSWPEHERMIKQAENFYQSLGLPYHVVSIVSGAINDAAAKKYDLEGWFPGDAGGKGQYRELVSCSNCLDFQTRRMNTFAGFGEDQQVPHMLNSTLCATGRAICCILENYQTPHGVNIPAVLIPYMAGTDFIPFVKPPPGAEDAPKKAKG